MINVNDFLIKFLYGSVCCGISKRESFYYRRQLDPAALNLFEQYSFEGNEKKIQFKEMAKTEGQIISRKAVIGNTV